MGAIALTARPALAAPGERMEPDPWPQFKAAGGAAHPDYREARQLLSERKWPEAVIVLRSIHRRDPSSPTVALDLVRALMFSGRREEALSILDQLLSHERRAPRKEFLARRIRVLSRMFVSNESFQIYQDGVNLLGAGKARSAQERFEKALALEPDNAEILMRLGQSLLLEQDEDSAAERLKLARRLNPHEPEIRLWLGRAMHRRGELREALESLKAANRELAGSELAPIWYAEVLVSAGQRAAALEALEKDTLENPGHVRALLALVRLRLATLGKDWGKDLQPIWAARKELQLALSRLSGYLDPQRPRFEGELGVELPRAQEELKDEIRLLMQQVESRLEKDGSDPIEQG